MRGQNQERYPVLPDGQKRQRSKRGQTVGNKGSYSIEHDKGESWIIVDANLELLDLTSMRGKYKKGATSIVFEKNEDPNDTITLLRD